MQTRIVETHRGTIEYSDAGKGDPVLYFHGTGITGEVMIPIESPLLEEGFRLLVPNRPGYGNTPLGTQKSTSDCADRVAALLDTLELPEVSVMGSSGGAGFAVAFALEYPTRTRSLVLLCPQLHRWSSKQWLPTQSWWTLPFLKLGLLRKLFLNLYRFQLRRTKVEQFLEMETGERFSEFRSDSEARSLCESTLTAMAQGVLDPGFENDFRVFVTEEILQPNRSLQPPSLIVHDPKDPMAPVAHVDWFASRVPHCQRVAVHTAGHLIWVGPEAALMHEARVRFLTQHLDRKPTVQ